MQAAALVQPGDAASAGSHLDDVEHRDANGEPLVVAAYKVIGRKTRLATADDAGLGGGAAHVEGDGGFEVEGLAQRHGPHHAARRPGFHHLDALTPCRVDVGEAAVGLHDCEVAGEPVASQAPLEVAEVAADLRTDVGIGHYGRGALVLAVLTGELVGGTDKEVGVGLTQDLTHPNLVLGSPVGMEEEHRHRLDARLLDDPRYFACLLFIEGGSLRAVGEYPFWDLENHFARNEGPVLAESGVERFGAVDPADLVDVTETLGRNQGGLGAVALDDRVHHDRGSVDQRQDCVQGHCCLGESLLDTPGQFGGPGEGLRQHQRGLRFVEGDDIRERAADVDCYPQLSSPQPINRTGGSPGSESATRSTRCRFREPPSTEDPRPRLRPRGQRSGDRRRRDADRRSSCPGS